MTLFHGKKVFSSAFKTHLKNNGLNGAARLKMSHKQRSVRECERIFRPCFVCVSQIRRQTISRFFFVPLFEGGRQRRGREREREREKHGNLIPCECFKRENISFSLSHVKKTGARIKVLSGQSKTMTALCVGTFGKKHALEAPAIEALEGGKRGL